MSSTIPIGLLTYAETHPICTLRTLRNPLRTLRLNPNYFNRKGRKEPQGSQRENGSPVLSSIHDAPFTPVPNTCAKTIPLPVL